MELMHAAKRDPLTLPAVSAPAFKSSAGMLPERNVASPPGFAARNSASVWASFQMGWISPHA